jgi:hypothetical protein
MASSFSTLSVSTPRPVPDCRISGVASADFPHAPLLRRYCHYVSNAAISFEERYRDCAGRNPSSC